MKQELGRIYMEMFIDFKLKVAEAEHRGLDTAQAFIDELKVIVMN